MLMKNFSPEIANSGKVRLTYETMDEYYSVFKPLLFLECWAQVPIGNGLCNDRQIIIKAMLPAANFVATCNVIRTSADVG